MSAGPSAKVPRQIRGRGVGSSFDAAWDDVTGLKWG
ncbi:hypothetical protein SAMN05414138_1024 [Rhodoplanes sp. JGI PP 4-B12]|nr:hypothetical protein SAMN05414138_1024 [Rhodoplanes sp. JGI PP 4-B12]